MKLEAQAQENLIAQPRHQEQFQLHQNTEAVTQTAANFVNPDSAGGLTDFSSPTGVNYAESAEQVAAYGYSAAQHPSTG